jgi:hypothetical protein
MRFGRCHRREAIDVGFKSMSPPLPKTTSLSTFTLACAGLGDCANARVPSAGNAVPADNAVPMNPRLVNSLIVQYLPCLNGKTIVTGSIPVKRLRLCRKSKKLLPDCPAGVYLFSIPVAD